MFLTVEEMNLIAMYRQETRFGTIENMRRRMKFVGDKEMREMMLQLVNVLERMEDEEFMAARFATAFEEEEKEIHKM